MQITLHLEPLFLPLLFLGLLFFCYAEIHYKFKFIPSRYDIEAPEIIADVPRRISPGSDLPILILVKDADLYPVRISLVTIQIANGTGPKRVISFPLDRNIAEPWWQRLLWVPRHHEDSGWRQVKVSFKVDLFGKAYLLTSDNYPLTKHQPFDCYFADDLLPNLADFYTGDLHTHSNYTSDQLEFGSPPVATVQMAQAMGHHFVAITDHSYDLDDEFEDYLKNDPDLKKWQLLQTEIRFFNASLNDFVVIPGEEVSCGNARQQNVHLLAFNNTRFIPGAGDSGEKWLHTKPDLSIPEVIEHSDPNCLLFAAHPEMPVPFLQRLLLKRNTWRWPDYQHEGLHGLQIWNGCPEGMSEARNSWVQLLLQGEKKFIIAGSDAHGNFNRFRQIGMPHLYMQENDRFQLFGQQRTILHIPEALTLDNLMASLRQGACSITSGPFLAITGLHPGKKPVQMGSTLTEKTASLSIVAYSTEEFGALERIIVLKGDIGASDESIILDESIPYKSFDFQTLTSLPPPSKNGSYYRAEALCNGNAPLPVMAMTNPIWHKVHSS